jgi:hypothetical protein
MDLTRQRSTRRGVVVAGAAAFAVTGLAAGARPVAALQTDRDYLDLLLAVVRAQAAGYTAMLESFDAPAFAAAGLPDTARSEVEQALGIVEDHAARLVRPGEPTLSDPAPVLDSGDLRDALRESLALANLATAAYAGVIPKISRQRIVPDLIGMHSVAARQAAWLATLTGDNPLPSAIDQALAPDDVSTRLASLTGAAQPSGTPSAADELGPMVAAIADELGLSPETIQVVSATPQVWPDASLGCPQPGQVYAQMLTPGYLVVVDAGGESIEFHTDEQGNVVRCP